MTETEKWKAAFVAELGRHFRPFDPAKPEDRTEAERAKWLAMHTDYHFENTPNAIDTDPIKEARECAYAIGALP